MQTKLIKAVGLALALALIGAGSAQALVIGPVRGGVYGAQLAHGGPFVEVVVSKSGHSAHVHAVCRSQTYTSASVGFTHRKPSGGFVITINRSAPHGRASILQGLFVGHQGKLAIHGDVNTYGFTACPSVHQRPYLILGHRAPTVTPTPTATPTPTPTPGTIRSEIRILSCPYPAQPANTNLTIGGNLRFLTGAPGPIPFAPVTVGYMLGGAGYAQSATVYTDGAGNFSWTVNDGPPSGPQGRTGVFGASYAGDSTYQPSSVQNCNTNVR